MNSCKNCNEPIVGNFCSNCGQPAKLKRIDKYYIIQELGGFFFANKGMIYTIKKILINPGDSVRRFITEDRYRFVKPITFLFVSSLIYVITSSLFNVSIQDYMDFDEGTIVSFVMTWLIEHPGYMNIIVGMFMAFFIKIFFKKAGYNIFEIFILMCFVCGMTTLFDSVGAIIQGITHLKFIQISIFISFTYSTWAIAQFFDRKKVASYIKAFLSYILGMLVFGFLIGVVGAIIDIIIKH